MISDFQVAAERTHRRRTSQSRTTSLKHLVLFSDRQKWLIIPSPSPKISWSRAFGWPCVARTSTRSRARFCRSEGYQCSGVPNFSARYIMMAMLQMLARSIPPYITVTTKRHDNYQPSRCCFVLSLFLSSVRSLFSCPDLSRGTLYLMLLRDRALRCALVCLCSATPTVCTVQYYNPGDTLCKRRGNCRCGLEIRNYIPSSI